MLLNRIHPRLALRPLLWLLLLCATPGLQADPRSVAESFGSDLLTAPAARQESALPASSPLLLSPTTGPVSFLPVEEAYRLSAQRLVDPESKRPLLSLHWDIAPGYYLYQHQLKVQLDGEDLPPLSLPSGIQKYDEYFERELQVYYHSLGLLIPLPEALDRATITVHSQGCAEAGLCYPPQQQQLRLDPDGVTLLAGSAPPTASTTRTAASAGLLLALAGALLGGILLNLMPCVFPVLSLKALSLAGHTGNPQRQRRHGWAYTFGAVTTFVGIAAAMLALRHAGQAVGWGFQLQSPLVVAALAYLFFILGLTLSGFIQLSSRFSGTGQGLTEGGGYRGSFFTGALATVVASPCTAPFMGGALGFAVTQPAPLALLVFAMLGLGMALPFLLLTYFPALSRHLPRPGRWMETLKQLLAFPLYLTAVWLLWVVGRQSGSDTVVMLLAGALGLALAAWLWQHRPARLLQRLLAAVIFIAAILPLGPLGSGGPAEQPTQAALANQWQPYSRERLQQLRDSGTPTFVNLTADWCITCLANEKVALETATVQQAFTKAGIVKLKGDWTHYNPEITHLLAEFDRNGVPLYLLYSGDTKAPPVILPQILRERTVLDAIDALDRAR